jgi:hypothetical protein
MARSPFQSRWGENQLAFQRAQRDLAPTGSREVASWVAKEGRTTQVESRRAREVVAAPVHHGGGWGDERDLRDDPAGLELLF